MAEIRASPVVNPSYKRIADVLAGLQGPMGQVIPFTDANPFKLLMPAAATFENLAYGNSPLAMPPGVTNRRLPIVKTGREGEFTDLASLGLLATGVPQVARGTMQGANYLGDVLTQATRTAPTAAPMRAVSEIVEAVPPASLVEPQAIVPKALQSDNPNLKNWAKGSEAVKESGEPVTLYHATTHDFDTFSIDRANPENHYGKGFYLTDSVDDANLNYAGIGPDLEIRIEQRTERLADELMDLDAEEIAEIAKNLKIDDSLIDIAGIEKSGASPELLREIARKELTTHGGAVMPVFARLQNPVKVGTRDETIFKIDTEFDEAGDLISESGNGIDLYNSLNAMGRQYDIPQDTIQDLWARISDDMINNEQISAGSVDKIIRNNLSDVYTPDGESAGPGQFIADVFRDMGFDGIKMDAGKYFGPREVGIGGRSKGMQGVEDATHYIVFEPTQIKSATGNIGTYSLTDPSIIRGAGVGATGLLGAGMYQDESTPLTKFLER